MEHAGPLCQCVSVLGGGTHLCTTSYSTPCHPHPQPSTTDRSGPRSSPVEAAGRVAPRQTRNFAPPSITRSPFRHPPTAQKKKRGSTPQQADTHPSGAPPTPTTTNINLPAGIMEARCLAPLAALPLPRREPCLLGARRGRCTSTPLLQGARSWAPLAAAAARPRVHAATASFGVPPTAHGGAFSGQQPSACTQASLTDPAAHEAGLWARLQQTVARAVAVRRSVPYHV